MKTAPIHSVTIIGGGITGIGVAVALAKAGIRTAIIEQQKHLGGRARSIFIPRLNTWIDNGQHALSTGYPATLQLLETLQSVSGVAFQSRLCIQFYYPNRPPFLYQARSLPAPFHFLFPILTTRQFSWQERIQLSTSLLRFFTHSVNVDVPLSKFFVPGSPLYRTFIDALALAALNTPASSASSKIFRKTLMQGFLTAPQYGALGIPTRPLYKILGEPAQAWLTRNGSLIYFNTRVTQLEHHANYWKIHLARQLPFKTRLLVLTLPPWQLIHLLQPLSPPLPASLLQTLGALKSHAILTLYLWFKHPLPTPVVNAFPYGPFQWLFTLPHIHNEKGYGYALVVSAPSRRFLNLSAAELAQKAHQQLVTQIGLHPDRFQPTAYFAIKEKRATIAMTPHTQPKQPAPGEILPGLFIAGDWTQTGLPATLESAVRSANIVADQILSRL